MAMVAHLISTRAGSSFIDVGQPPPVPRSPGAPVTGFQAEGLIEAASNRGGD
jgi:hypothetical protein